MAFLNEVLAPAGGMESVLAAVRCGADAVYLGGHAFNARRNAANFSEEELQAAVGYCHARGVKVYMTLNTLVGDDEMKTAAEEIGCACRLSVDALILQDIGLAALARRLAPGMPLHASTQMSVQSAEGVKLLEKAGFCRVVLARELSLEEIRAIAAETEAELEVFVHGALCMSVSGQCLLSAVLGSRSGNRGLCAQPCRLPFGVNGGKGAVLSLKDLSVISQLKELAEAGVSSFKIEGRMKRPEYVAAAVTACRESLNGGVSTEAEEALRGIFSRSGFTKGYVEGKLGPHMFGTRQKEDVEGAAPVLKKLKTLYDKELPRVPVDAVMTCAAGSPLTLQVSALGKTVTVTGETPEPALQRPTDETELRERLAKCGGTQFYLRQAEIHLQPGLRAAASAVNALRRDALQQLDAVLQENAAIACGPYVPQWERHTANREGFTLRLLSPEQLPSDLSGAARVILPLTASREAVEAVHRGGAAAWVELPRSFFGNGERFRTMLKQAVQNGADGVSVGTLDGLHLALQSGLPVSAGFGMNIFNSESLAVLEGYGVEDALISCELTLNRIARLGGTVKRGVMVYGRIPLMLTRNCPVKNALSCKECGGKSVLTDRMGIDFPVRCGFGCSEVLNSRPIYLADRLQEIKNTDYLLLCFTDESKEECQRILDAYRRGEAPAGEFTRGLYYRGVE